MADVYALRQELEEAHQRVGYLEQLADQDTLAPVLNRRAFIRELDRMAAFEVRYGAAGAVLYFDLDHLKAINDRCGHAPGDAVLKLNRATVRVSRGERGVQFGYLRAGASALNKT